MLITSNNNFTFRYIIVYGLATRYGPRTSCQREGLAEIDKLNNMNRKKKKKKKHRGKQTNLSS